MERLFSYGTLQQENVQRANFGRVLEGECAVLQGYVLSEVKIEDKDVITKSGKQYHPILVRTGNQTDEITGHCYWLSTKELMQADSYEVAEYTRIKAKTKDGQACWIYAASKEQKNA
ncbi:gamma-glutamylcyclotransferase family protein [Pseudoalteromonas sp. XMcav1-K]|uniref:gamma-glutamylcyclotransferase family protein n=1 Tax=Pseudoalteromonas sp. XMcav1-K TaxID=3374372 RepID=UPI003757ACBF